MSSTYETAADIDLFELFYNGTQQGDSATEEEWAAYEAENGFVDCDVTRVSTAEADKVLKEYTGLTLAEANKASLEAGFTYLPEFDAYFNGHGDTNYRGQVDITAGVREGDLVHLYYNDTFYAGGWKCVTLRETEDGGYQFVSNLTCEKPVIATVYPEGEPLLAIPLAGLTGSEPQAVETVHHSGDCAERFTYGKNWDVWGRHVQGYRSTDGKIYVAEITAAAAGNGVMTTWEADCFLEMPNEAFSIDLYQDLFGRDGFSLQYTGDMEGAYTAYYAFDEDGTLRLLCTVPGYGVDCQIMDLDGDGVSELLCTDGMQEARLYFQRDGKICEADVAALLREAWPGADGYRYIEFSAVKPYIRSLSCWSLGTAAKEDGTEFEAMLVRNIYFDGESLLVYKPDKTAVDHVTPGVTAPEDVMKAARDFVESAGIQTESDGWRILSLAGPWYEPFDGFTVEVYRVNYEHHSTAPEDVMWAGGIYVDEDGWVSPGYPDCDYLYFRVDGDGNRTYLFSMMENDCGPGGELFREDLESMLVQNGFLEPSPGQTVQEVWDAMKDHESLTLTLRTADGGGTCPNLGYNEPGDLLSDYTWEALTEDRLPNLSGAASLTISAPSNNLIFYEEPQVVYCNASGAESWYRAAYTGQGDVFGCELFELFRRWYDEAELNALRAAIPAIPDDGRSREEIVREWVEAYEGAYRNVTDGSHLKWSYMDIRDVDLHYWDEVDMTELLTEYKESANAQDVFLFNYSAVFVPEGDPDWFIAGNTGDYTGTDAPEGALQWWRCGYMYLLEDGWHCDGAGTGP